MTTWLSDIPAPGGWTTDDLEALPEDGRRRELLDGVLLLYPSPTDVHQIIAARLMVALEQTCPEDFQVTQAVEVRFGSRRSFIPDVLVTTDAAARRGGRYYAPHEVALAIEVVLPTSQIMDRITKPALYAKAGIPYYWVIETDGGLTVHTYRLDFEHEVYRPSGSFTDLIEIDQPWRIEIPMARLRPRHL
jgi:Uma2 family endonuclease